MSALSPEARKLLQRSHGAGGPSSTQRAAMKRAVLGAVLVPSVAAAATTGASVAATGASVAKAAGIGLAAKLSAVVVSVGVGAGLMWQVVSPARVPPERVAQVVVSARVEPRVAPIPEPSQEAVQEQVDEAPGAFEQVGAAELAPSPVISARPNDTRAPPRRVAAPVEAIAAPRAGQDPAPVAREHAVDEATLSREVAALSGAMGAGEAKQFAVASKRRAPPAPPCRSTTPQFVGSSDPASRPRLPTRLLERTANDRPWIVGCRAAADWMLRAGRRGWERCGQLQRRELQRVLRFERHLPGRDSKSPMREHRSGLRRLCVRRHLLQRPMHGRGV
jgi:hypothetical protein